MVNMPLVVVVPWPLAISMEPPVVPEVEPADKTIRPPEAELPVAMPTLMLPPSPLVAPPLAMLT
jgi:hypothetical protein